MAQNVRDSELFQAETWTAVYQAFQNINFQSYSFTTIKSALLTYIQQQYPEDFTDWSQNSEFIFIVDIIAYLGEVLSYRVDLNARDNILDTAERRSTIISMVKMLSYNIHRNIAANGLVKIMSISTTQSVVDSNGIDLSNRVILWNDPSNADWYEQFILVLNSSFVSSNLFGNPVQAAIVNNIPTQLYQLNNVPGLSAADSFSVPVSGQAMDFEVVNPSFNPTQGFFEINPDQNSNKGIIYLNDGSGNASPTSGFFLLFRQGTLRFQDYLFELPIVNRLLPLAATNVNDTDVWVQQVDDRGNTTSDWVKVDSTENIVYNSLGNSIRNIFSVITDDSDKVTLRFSDGNFGDIPTGNFRMWYRQSNGLTYTIRPVDMRNVVISVPYTTNTVNTFQQTYTLSINFSLQQSVSNSAPSETVQSAQQNAPNVFYTQDRMCNNQDYNTFPLTQGQSIVKMTAINRTYSGHSQYFDILDPTKSYSSTIEFGNDGALYQQPYTLVSGEPLPTSKSTSDILETDILPLLLNPDYKNFFYAENPSFSLSSLYWGLVTSTATSSTGFFVTAAQVPQNIGPGLTTNNLYLTPGALVEFVNPNDNTQTMWSMIESVSGNGTQFTSTNNGAVFLGNPVPNGWIANIVYPAFRNTMLSSEYLAVINQLNNNNSFGIRYNLASSSWVIITTLNLDQTSPFSLTHAGDTSNSQLDASWVIMANYSTSGWTFTARYLKYVFESIERSRFFFSPDTKAIDIETNQQKFDTINVLSFNTAPNSSQPLGASFPFQITQAIRYADGFIEPRRIQVSPAEDLDGAFINPLEFAEVVAPNVSNPNSYVFQKQFTDNLGYTYYQIVNASTITEFLTPTAMLGAVSWTNGQVAFALSTNQFFEYIDGTIKPITISNTTGVVTLAGHQLQTGSAIAFYVGPPPASPTPTLPSPLIKQTLYYAYVIDDNTFSLGNTIGDVTSNPPILIPSFSIGSGTISALTEITQTQEYFAFLGRQNLNYSYEHFAAQDERIDPSVTNVIDMFMLTNDYYNQVLTWKNSQDTGPFPAPPTTYELSQQFAGLQPKKMVSDEMIFQPANFKLLFGPGAQPELQALFKVVPSLGTTVTNNEIQQQVIANIDNFFDITKNRFDFGETFYFTELSAYIHKQMYTMIASIVIVPMFGPSSFGDLFQVRCDNDELFLSTATVANVEIINAITDSTLRVA